MHFQDLILTLQSFWTKRGCLLVQPYNSEVGAGTYNPATFLRALGPEPWNVAFVEPSRRPSDGRYGENPNRLQQFHQFQVILKPSPLDIQDLYLESLGALGTRPGAPRHPLRRGRLGVADARRLGARLAGVARRARDQPVHLLPAGRRASTAGLSRASSPTASSGSRCTCRTRTASTT